MRRRKFLATSGLASAGILTSTSVMAKISKNIYRDKTINIGVIGIGDRGGALISVLNEIESMNVAAVCDVLPFRLKNGLSRTDNKAKAYINYKHLLENKNIDAVLIATPFNTHAKIAIDSIDANKHIYCEKTMAKGLKEIKSLVNKASNSNKIFQTGHQHQSSMLYKHIVNLINKGEIGQIASFECQWNRYGNWRRPVPEPYLERAINWRMYREYSGGLVAELCSHQIDFVNWVLGENPHIIMGTGGIDFWKDGRETFDNVHLLYEYPSGVKAKFTCLTNNSLFDYKIKIQGSEGTILLDHRKAWIYYEKGFEKKIGEVDGVSGATINQHLQGKPIPIEIEHIEPSKQALIDFRDAIMENKEPISNIYTGANTSVAVQLSLEAMYNKKIKQWKKKYTYSDK